MYDLNVVPQRLGDFLTTCPHYIIHVENYFILDAKVVSKKGNEGDVL